jgi:hypothetical protein
VLLTVEEEVSADKVKIVVPVLKVLNIFAIDCLKFESMSSSPNLIFLNSSADNRSQVELIIQLANYHTICDSKCPCRMVPLNLLFIACHKLVSSIKKFSDVTAHILLKCEETTRMELGELA